MNKTTTTKKATVKTASLNMKFAIGIPKGATGALVKSFAPGRAPSLKAYPGLVNMTTAGAKTATIIAKINGRFCWAPARSVILA